MIHRKKGQGITDDASVETSKSHKWGLFGKKTEEYNVYDQDMEYLEEENPFEEESEDESEELTPTKKKKPWDFLKKKKGEKADPSDGDAVPDDSGHTEKEEKNTEESEDNILTQEEEIILAEPQKKKISKKKLGIIAGVAVVILIAVVFFVIKNIGGGTDEKAYVQSVSEITGLGSANGMNNRYTGVVDAQSSWKISLQSDLSVEKRYVNVGDQVKKGDKLFKYNTEELRLSKEKKELEQETMQNEITQLTKDIKSYQSDLKTASASEKIELQTQILTAQTTIKKDQFNIKSNKTTIKNLEKNIKDATVKSIMNGLVKKINTSLETASDSDSSSDDSDMDSDSSYDDGSSSDTSYMTILAVGNYRVTGTISETNVQSLNEGDSVIIRSRVDDSKTWTGTVSKIKTDATADSSDDSSDGSEDYSDTGDDTSQGESATSYNFYVKLDDDTGLMMGQHVFVEQDNGQDSTKEGIWLPSAYLKKDGNQYYVWMASHNKLKLQKVSVGEYDEDLDEYEITSGLKVSDYIASDGGSLEEGMSITKVSPEEDTSDNMDEESGDDVDDSGDSSDYEELDEG